eukprot:1157445-Pelagomonas_calceolata.AAC.10
MSAPSALRIYTVACPGSTRLVACCVYAPLRASMPPATMVGCSATLRCAWGRLVCVRGEGWKTMDTV